MRALLLALLLAAPAGAQVLPAQVKDRATEENLEFLLRKIKKLDLQVSRTSPTAASTTLASSTLACPSVIYLNSARTAWLGCGEWRIDPGLAGDIHLAGSTPLRFWIGGSEQMRLDESGNLGLGTAAPGYKLDVAGSAHFSAAAVDGLLTAARVGISNYAPSFMLDVAGDGAFSSNLKALGHVGIGTAAGATPSLHVYSSTRAVVTIESALASDGASNGTVLNLANQYNTYEIRNAVNATKGEFGIKRTGSSTMLFINQSPTLNDTAIGLGGFTSGSSLEEGVSLWGRGVVYGPSGASIVQLESRATGAANLGYNAEYCATGILGFCAADGSVVTNWGFDQASSELQFVRPGTGAQGDTIGLQYDGYTSNGFAYNIFGVDRYGRFNIGAKDMDATLWVYQSSKPSPGTSYILATSSFSLGHAANATYAGNSNVIFGVKDDLTACLNGSCIASWAGVGVVAGTVTANASQFSGTGSGSSPLTLLSSSITLQANTFNGASQLVQTTAAGLYPALDGSLITNITAVSAGTVTANASQFSGTGSGSSPLTLLSSSVTLQGNTNVALLNSTQTFSGQNRFNAQLTVSSGMTVSGMVGIGTTNPIYNLELFGTAYTHGNYWIDGPADGSVTLFADSSNRVGIGAASAGSALHVFGDVKSSGSFVGDGHTLTDLSASALASGTVPNARLDSSSVTLKGQGVAVLADTQTFTGANTFSSSVTVISGARDISFSTGAAAGASPLLLVAASSESVIVGVQPSTTNVPVPLPFQVWGAGISIANIGTGAVNVFANFASGVSSAPAAVAALTNLVRIQARGFDGVSWSSASHGEFSVATSEAWSPSGHGTSASISTTLNGTTTTRQERFRVGNEGHIDTLGIGISTASAQCGVNPTLNGNDNTGIVTIGTGGGTDCVLTFGNAWANSPSCRANNRTTGTALGVIEATTTLTIKGTFTVGQVLSYHCDGWR